MQHDPRDDTAAGDELVTCPYCAGRGQVPERRPASTAIVPCSVCAESGVVPVWKKARFMRSLAYIGYAPARRSDS